MSLNKKPKSTYLSEIIDNAKKPGGSRPGPTDYNNELALDFTKIHATKLPWNKMNKTSWVHDIIAREKNLKGPADYKVELK